MLQHKDLRHRAVEITAKLQRHMAALLNYYSQFLIGLQFAMLGLRVAAKARSCGTTSPISGEIAARP